MEKNKRIGKEKGITLVALVVTIIILIILATISVNMVFSENGLIKKAREAREHQSNALENDKTELKRIEEEYANMMGKETEINPPEKPTGPAVTINGSTVTLTQDNVYDYLGKIVTNYTGASSVTIGSTEYKVSPTYRLYYVDFANKYGDGEGTIYLKAECTSNNYSLPITDTSLDTDSNVKIKALNPSLYATGMTSPSTSYDNMKAVTWLTNTNNWAGLADTSMSSNINYIIGAPPLEMMMDSYNTHYKLTEDTPDYSAITAGTRRKLFYKYTSGKTGYQVGPNANNKAEYDIYTSDNSVYTDSKIDTMYYPGSNQCYWLASPSASSYIYMMYVNYYRGGIVNVGACTGDFRGYNALCPVVSLKSSVQLQLQ